MLGVEKVSENIQTAGEKKQKERKENKTVKLIIIGIAIILTTSLGLLTSRKKAKIPKV